MLGAISTKFWLEANRRMRDSTLNWLPLIKNVVQGFDLYTRAQRREPADDAHEVDAEHAAEFAPAARVRIQYQNQQHN